jgi:hypothetical protein
MKPASKIKPSGAFMDYCAERIKNGDIKHCCIFDNDEKHIGRDECIIKWIDKNCEYTGKR